MCLSRCIVSFCDTKTTTGTTTKLFIRPNNLRVLALGFIDLLLFKPVQKFIPPHQQPISNVERRKSRVVKYAIGGRAQDLTCVQQKFSLKIKQASRRLKRLACFGDGSDDVYGIWVGYAKKTVIIVICVTIVTQGRCRGSGVHPRKCVCGYPNAMLAKHIYPKKRG